MTNKCLECGFDEKDHPIVVLKNYIPSDRYLEKGEFGMDSDEWNYLFGNIFKFHSHCKEFKTEIQLTLF